MNKWRNTSKNKINEQRSSSEIAVINRTKQKRGGRWYEEIFGLGKMFEQSETVESLHNQCIKHSSVPVFHEFWVQNLQCLRTLVLDFLTFSLLKRILDSTICHPFKENLLYYSGIGFACCFRSINNGRSNI